MKGLYLRTVAARLALLISGAVSTGTSGAMAREAEPPSANAGDVGVVVDGAIRHQTIDGFGQAEPGVLVHPVPESLGDKQRAAGVDKAYRQVGINLGIIGSLLESRGGRNHLQNDNADPFTINWSGFDPENLTLAKKYVVDLAKPYGFTNYYLGAEAPNIRWASPWLADIRKRNYNTYLDEVAEQVLANVAYWKNTYGEELPYYQLGNEQLSGNRCMIDPVKGGYGPVDPVQQMVDITKRAGARLRHAGFRRTRFIVGTEETEYVSLRVAAAILSDPAARPYVGAIGYHSYPYGQGYSSAAFILRTSGAGTPDAARVGVRHGLRDLGKKYGVDVWMTENSNGGPPLAYGTFRARAIQIHDEMLYADASAYFGEWAMWDLTSQRLRRKNSDLKGDDAEGNVVLINEDTGAVNITGIGYAIGHYARWVKPGAVRIEAESNNPRVQVSAFRDDKRGTVALVLINNAATSERLAVSLTGLGLAGRLTGEQSTASGYWKPIGGFVPSSATAFTITLPQTSVTSVGGKLKRPE